IVPEAPADNAHAEASPKPRDALADRPQAEQAERLALQLWALNVLPGSLSHAHVADGDRARDREYQADRQLRHRWGPDPGRVGDGDAALLRGSQIHVIGTSAED